MAYATYTTQALVCGTWSKNTSDKTYLLFTREAGMLYADARSVREEKSKQRYGLQDFSRCKVSLVKGKGGWRLGSVEALENYYQSAVDKAARGSIVQLFRFLRRFYKGEEAAPELFDYLVEACAVLQTSPLAQAQLQARVELQILTELGYVNKSAIPTQVLTLPVAAATTLDTATMTAIDKLIEQATTSSQL